jgi:hypothetical protein
MERMHPRALPGVQRRERHMTPAETLARLAEYRATECCRRCDCLDWAIAQLQGVGDYALACEAAALRAPDDRLESHAVCQPCPPLDAVFAWLRLSADSAR